MSRLQLAFELLDLVAKLVSSLEGEEVNVSVEETRQLKERAQGMKDAIDKALADKD